MLSAIIKSYLYINFQSNYLSGLYQDTARLYDVHYSLLQLTGDAVVQHSFDGNDSFLRENQRCNQDFFQD